MLDIDLDPAVPDYIISSDLIIPSGITLDFDPTSSQGITVKVADNAGIIVQAGGAFRAINGSQYKLTVDTGWKGILVDGGKIQIEVNTTIENAGTSTFSGQTEPAANNTEWKHFTNCLNVSGSIPKFLDLMIY